MYIKYYKYTLKREIDKIENIILGTIKWGWGAKRPPADGDSE